MLNVSVFVEETQPDDQQCLGQILWYQLLTSLDRNAQGGPRNCGNNGYWELTPTLAQRQCCNYCNRIGILSFLGLTTALVVSVIVEEFQPNAQQCLSQKLFGTIYLQVWIWNDQGEPRNCGNNGYRELTLTSAQRQCCKYYNRIGIISFLVLTT